jgi:hypothetical protein
MREALSEAEGAFGAELPCVFLFHQLVKVIRTQPWDLSSQSRIPTGTSHFGEVYSVIAWKANKKRSTEVSVESWGETQRGAVP